MIPVVELEGRLYLDVSITDPACYSSSRTSVLDVNSLPFPCPSLIKLELLPNKEMIKTRTSLKVFNFLL